MTRNKVEAKRRRELYRAALASIAALSDSELKNLKHEIGRAMASHAKILNDLRLRVEAIKTEQSRRRTKTSVPGIHISDHALVRYLERVRGVDMTAVREEIVALATRAGRQTDGKYGRRLDQETGIALGMDEETEHVTTVFNDREMPVLET